MGDIYNDFASYLRVLLRSGKHVVFLSSARDFSPFWREFSAFIVEAARSFGSGVGRVARLIYGGDPPDVSVVPRIGYYIAYVKNQKNVDDVYLAISAAHASSTSNFLPVAIPAMSHRFVVDSAKKSMNPALLEQVFLALPFIASIPCNDVVRSVGLVRDVLAIKYRSYLLSSDASYNALGASLSAAMSMVGEVGYRESFESLLKMVLELIGRRGFESRVASLSAQHQEVEVTLYTVFLD